MITLLNRATVSSNGENKTIARFSDGYILTHMSQIKDLVRHEQEVDSLVEDYLDMARISEEDEEKRRTKMYI